MTEITFLRVAEDEARILSGGEYIGDLYRRHGILNPGPHCYVLHLIDDPRGPVRVHDRSRVREVAQTMAASHPYW